VQAVAIDGVDVLRVHITENDVVSTSRHVGANRAANRACSNDGELHFVPFEEPLASV
jgi:hypothetical protein